MEDMKKRPYDLLDYGRTQFDRDLLEFSVHINDLEAALQVGAGGGEGAARAGAWVWMHCPMRSTCDICG